MVKKLITLTPEMAQAIMDYRFANRINSELETIRVLLDAGLRSSEKKKQKSKGAE